MTFSNARLEVLFLGAPRSRDGCGDADAGGFFHLHSLGVDPKGNIVTGASQGYRVQKFIYKGLPI